MRILVPIDFTNTTKKGLEYAIHVAKQGGHSISTIFVAPRNKAQGTKLKQKLKELAQEEDKSQHDLQLTKFKESLKDSNFQFEEHLIRYGNVSRRIMIESLENDYDLVIMSTKGASKLEEAFFATTTFNYLQIAAKPTIVVPQDWSIKNTKNACIALRVDNFYTKTCKQLIKISKKLGFNPSFITVVNKKVKNLHQTIGYKDAQYNIDVIEHSSPIETINKHIETNEISLLGLHFNLHSKIRSLTTPLASREFSYRSSIPILFVK